MGAAATMLTSLYTNCNGTYKAIHHFHATDFVSFSFFMIAIAFSYLKDEEAVVSMVHVVRS
jgi:hypothetical protein